MRLRLHTVEKNVTALGPGVRYAVWVQGCERRCPGCISPETWDKQGGYETDSRRVARSVVESGCEGLTISGGEPFLQAEALTDLILSVKEEREIGVIIYTGNTFEELQCSVDQYVQRLLSLCDLLIDGVYDESRNDGRNLRGSSNQRAIPLTERYRAEAAEYGTKAAHVEFFIHDGITRMVGIPSREQLEHFQRIKW